ncbi:MAG: phosphoribosylformylglycinamidine synthase subunit PurQ [Pseudobdellovibrionaceae bacterium]
MSYKVGVLRFPGTNCDRDIEQAVNACEGTPEYLWHLDQFDYKKYSALVIPGGFSYGDYLRCGALASRSPVMKSVIEAANKGTPILGICNGFQILCESGLLPGALVKNDKLRFIDQWVGLKLSNTNPYFAKGLSAGHNARLPIAHGEGRFYADTETLKKIEDNGQVWWTYEQTPNGSMKNIAGIMNDNKNVAALMPHPERAIFEWMGSEDGRNFFEN